MPATVAEFVKAAHESGILDVGSLAERLTGIDHDTDPAAFAKHLVEDGRLTEFQAAEVCSGNAKSLVIGPYVVLDILGKGGMGCVYRAEHRIMRRLVALKVIATTAFGSPTAIVRFQREVLAAARLEHPNIVTAFDAGEFEGTHYLVMQLVDGPNLAQAVRERGPQPPERAVNWVLQAAKGLAFAHEQGVVHRDIKPGNLLVDSRGTLKILDMGLAKLDTLDAGQDQLTGTGQIMGTLDYMAPEQALDTRRADARSDIYSLGVTLWYLLTGRLLFEADSVVKKIMAHQQQPAPSLAEAPVSADPRLDAVFQRMVAKHPADRFQSMREVIAAIEMLPHESVAAGTPSRASHDGPTAPSPPDMTAERMHRLTRKSAAHQDTARATAGDVDTGAARGKADAKPEGSLVHRTRAALAIVGGPLLLLGLVMFAFDARRDVESSGRGGNPADDAGLQSASRADAVPSMAVSEPAASPSDESAVASVATDSRVAPSSAPPSPAIAPFDAVQARQYQEAWAKHLGVTVETTNSIGVRLAVIPPGTFTMGQAGAEPNEKPHRVTLTKPFFMSVHEVTQAQWEAVMGKQPSKWKQADRPVEQVSWDDAVGFCRALAARPQERQAGRVYRLPTEAEWEFACRAGVAAQYSFGDDGARMREFGWIDTNSDRQTQPVGWKAPNAWGLYDMHGNVFEWCSDGYADYSQFAATDPQGPSLATRRIFRGGSHRSGAGGCRSAGRRRDVPSRRDSDLGFRLAVSLSDPIPPAADSQ